MSRFQFRAKDSVVLFVSILMLGACGYKGPLVLPEKAETNQPESSQQDEQTDSSSQKEQ